MDHVFSLYSSSAKKVVLGFFTQKETQPFATYPMKLSGGGVWETMVKIPSEDTLYGFQIDGGNWVADPFAKALNTSTKWGEKPPLLLSKLSKAPPFDWEGDRPLQIPLEELVIYEMHVKEFSQTFHNMVKKIPYLQSLGINAVELLPIMAFDETEHKGRYNYWGYSPLHFFSLMTKYGSAEECKILVKELHKAGIEVILDVVFNHTGGNNSLQEIDRKTYYLLDDQGNHTNYSGCGNTLRCNHPKAIELILSSLRYFVEIFHIDGFRFDLASIFCRGDQGKALSYPPVIEAIEKDPLLKDTKLIAEPWDCAGLYQVGSFPGNFAQWNGDFRDAVRNFLKGTDHAEEAFANALVGWQRRYKSINFVTAHDGFTLHDLVSYNTKHNEKNGEENRDGNDHNLSWNCGIEGPTENPDILFLREKQMRNFLLANAVALGTPMFLMGDEYGRSKGGNNNSYCQEISFEWEEKDKGLEEFFRKLIKFRKEFRPTKPNCKISTRLVACMLGDHFIVFNAHFEPTNVKLPKGKTWEKLLDTHLLQWDEKPMPIQGEYTLHSHSALVAKNREI